MGPLLKILEVLGKDASVGENLGDIVQHRGIAVRERIALVMYMRLKVSAPWVWLALS